MNLGFNFDDSYDQVTSKNFHANETLNETGESSTSCTVSKHELLNLLALCESDLERKDKLIEKLNAERVKFFLHEAKYGKLCANDPFLALKRDSILAEEELDEKQIGQMYESQLIQLEKLINVQRKTHSRAKSILNATEKRHAKILRELEQEKDRQSRYAEQGDDVLALLEKERNKLLQQLDAQMTLVSSGQEAREKLERRLEEEREKHKAMIMFLINERKQLLIRLHEMRLKQDAVPPAEPSPAAQDALIEQMRQEIKCLRQERDAFKTESKSLKGENLNLKEVVKSQENDLTQLKKNLIGNAKLPFEQQRNNVPTTLPNLSDTDSAYVMANRMAEVCINNASTSAAAPRRLANSSSFPTERSKLPRAPASPARTVTTISARIPASPTKKMPAMGLGTIRQRVPPPTIEPELQELESAIKSIGISSEGPNVAPASSPTKRSSSLPRGKSEQPGSRRTEPLIPVYKTEPRMTPQMGSRIVPPSRIESSQSTAKKLSGTVKRNGLSALTKAFGK